MLLDKAHRDNETSTVSKAKLITTECGQGIETDT